MASVLGAITYTQQLIQGDSNAIGSVLGLALYNDALQAWTRDMLNKGLDAAQTQEAYHDLTTDSPQTHLWPSDMYALKTIEINFQDQSGQNYIQATPVDVANLQGVSFSWLRINQSQQEPLFDNRGDQFEIFPVPTVANTQGIRIFYYLTPTEATVVTDSIVYPQLLDYRTLSTKMASTYYKTQGDMENANLFEQEYQARINKIIRIVEPGTQQPITPKPVSLSGWQF